MPDMKPGMPSPTVRTFLPMLSRGVVTLWPLTGDAAILVDAVGADVALRVMMRLGGTGIDLSTCTAVAAISDLIGADASADVLHAIGPRPLDPAIDAMRGAPGRRSRGLWLLANGRSLSAVALACDVNARTATYWRKALNRLSSEDLAKIHQEEPR